MQVFFYDKTFGGLLSALFDCYSAKVFPDVLLTEEDIPPLTMLSAHHVRTEEEKSNRVWAGLRKKLTRAGLDQLSYAWLSEEEGSDLVLLRYLRKIFDSSRPIETNYADADVLKTAQLSRKVCGESQLLLGFTRFQKTVAGIYFAPIAPKHNSLPLLLKHFADRFACQPWILYDTKRHYGVFCENGDFKDMILDKSSLQGCDLRQDLLDDDEKLFQTLWRHYCQAITIRERINPKLQARLMPRRFWPMMTECGGKK